MHPESHSLRSKIGLDVITICRYAVLYSGAIACFCLCYLAYEHYFHYCSYSTWSCTEVQRQHEKIPWAIIIFIFTVSHPHSSYASKDFLFLARQLTMLAVRGCRARIALFDMQFPEHEPAATELSAVASDDHPGNPAIYLISYRIFFKLPGVKLPCPFGPTNYRNLKDAPETYDCCIAMGVIVAGGIAL